MQSASIVSSSSLRLALESHIADSHVRHAQSFRRDSSMRHPCHIRRAHYVVHLTLQRRASNAERSSSIPCRRINRAPPFPPSVTARAPRRDATEARLSVAEDHHGAWGRATRSPRPAHLESGLGARRAAAGTTHSHYTVTAGGSSCPDLHVDWTSRQRGRSWRCRT